MYGINKWFRFGMMLEWENHHIDSPRNGSLNTITLLPVNLEYRPGHFGSLIPYVTSGIGVNINTKDQADSFAWRFGAGLDYPMTSLFQGAPKGLMLNMETAWKRNSADGDRSAMGLLFGVRHTF
jgi:outer membrane protein